MSESNVKMYAQTYSKEFGAFKKRNKNQGLSSMSIHFIQQIVSRYHEREQQQIKSTGGRVSPPKLSLLRNLFELLRSSVVIN